MVNILSKLNGRLIALHFIAFWLFIHALLVFSYLYDMAFIVEMRNDVLNENTTDPLRLFSLSLWNNISGTIGLLVAFIISLIICIRRHWFWVNALLTYIIAYTMGWLNLLGWSFFKNIFLSPGALFNNVYAEFIVNGTILLMGGLLIFFLPQSNRFIERGRKSMEIKKTL